MRVWLIYIAMFYAFASREAVGMFMRLETEPVPIARLLANLEERQAKNTNDFEVTYQLARLHSMAYSTNLDQVEVRKDNGAAVFAYPWSDSGVPPTVARPKNPMARQAAFQHLTNAVSLYERSILLLRRSTNIADQIRFNTRLASRQVCAQFSRDAPFHIQC